jgi:hypothetical protein
VTRDKPVLITALACADVLLTPDRRDFRTLLGQSVYDRWVLTPGDFMRIERESHPVRIFQSAQDGRGVHIEREDAGNNEAPAFDYIEQAKAAAEL